MIVLDTTILVYAVGDRHPLRDPCREIVRHVQDGRAPARTTVEVIQEFTHVRARRRGRNDAAVLGREFAGLLQPLIVVDELDLARGLDLFEHHGSLGAFDAILAGAAMRRGAVALVSADDAFGDISGLRALHPLRDLPSIVGA